MRTTYGNKHFTFTLLALAIAAACIGTGNTARAFPVPVDNNWVQVGTTPTGFIIVGDGTQLGGLSQATNIPLSATGGDRITENPGAVATSLADTVFLETPNNVFTIYGTLHSTGATAFHILNIAATGNTLINYGTIMGHYGVDIGTGRYNTLVNYGSIVGTVNNAVDFGDRYNVAYNYGSIVSGDAGYEASDKSNTLYNYGTITGGNRGGVALYGDNNIINNYAGGLINVHGSSPKAFQITSSSNLINNWGMILNTQPNGFALFINSGGNNNMVNNWGTIAANSGDAFTVNGGSGNTLNNYGILSGNGHDSVHIIGDNNVVNLYGHSITNGLIAATGNNNVLNIRLSGISPAEAANITAQLKAEGVLDGQPSSGSIDIRGNVIQWDPLIVHFLTSSYQGQALTPNQAAVGASLDSATVNPTGSLLTFFDTIDAGGNVPLTLEALSPQKYQIYGDIAQANANFMTLEIDNRLNNLRDGSETIDTTGIGGETTVTAGYSKDGKNVVVPDKEALAKRWGFFASGQGLFGNVDAHGGDLSDAGFTTSSLILGVDGKVSDRLVLGLLFNYDYTAVDLDHQGSRANAQTLGGGVYAGYHNGSWYGNGLATYGHNSYDSTRLISFPGFNQAASGSTNGNQYTADLDGGYDFHINDHLTAGPLAGLEYVHLDVDGFNEAGAGVASLAVGSQNMDSLRSRIGFRADYRRQLGKEVAFATELRAAWQHEFLDDSRGISGSFIGTGLAPFTVQSTNPQRDAAIAGVGVNFTVRDTMTVFFDYDVQAGQQSYLENSVKGGLKFSF